MNNITAIIKGMTIDEWKKGGFRGRLSLDNGKRKAFYGKTVSEVKNKAKEYLKKIENGYSESEKILLNDFIEYWLIHYKKDKIEPSSYSRLWRLYRNNIKNDIGLRMIGSIETKDIQKLLDSYINPPDSNMKALSKSGLKKIKDFLNPCFKVAIKEKVIQNNPCEGIILPQESCMKVKSKKQFSLTNEELAILKEHCLEKDEKTDEYKERNRLIILLLVNLGLRIGEMLALQWSDISFQNRMVRINKTLQENELSELDKEGFSKKYTYIIKDSTKTKNGVRCIPLNPLIIEYLYLLKEYDRRNGIVSEFVACNRKGDMNRPINLSRTLNRIKKEANLNPKITLHTLRHSFGSSLIRNKTGIEVISKLMGHANITITLNNYIHTIQEEEVKAMNGVAIC